MIAIMWQFDVKKGHEGSFEQMYGVDGEWTSMNRLTRSYLGTSFLRDQNRPQRYLVIEYWSDLAPVLDDEIPLRTILVAKKRRPEIRARQPIHRRPFAINAVHLLERALMPLLDVELPHDCDH